MAISYLEDTVVRVDCLKNYFTKISSFLMKFWAFLYT